MRRLRDGGVVYLVIDGSEIYVFDPISVGIGHHHQCLRQEAKAKSCVERSPEVEKFRPQSEVSVACNPNPKRLSSCPPQDNEVSPEWLNGSRGNS